MLARFLKDDSGVTAMEYGLIAGFILCAVIGTLALIGPELKVPFVTLQGGIEAANAKS